MRPYTPMQLARWALLGDPFANDANYPSAEIVKRVASAILMYYESRRERELQCEEKQPEIGS